MIQDIHKMYQIYLYQKQKLNRSKGITQAQPFRQQQSLKWQHHRWNIQKRKCEKGEVK